MAVAPQIIPAALWKRRVNTRSTAATRSPEPTRTRTAQPCRFRAAPDLLRTRQQPLFNPKVAGSIPARPMQRGATRAHETATLGIRAHRNASTARQRTTNTKVTG
jgi:hypothetical protein